MESESISEGNIQDTSIYVRNPDPDTHKPENNKEMREIGDLAVWTLSSAKQGHGVGK